MFYDEEEINNELSKIEEQEEMKHIHWLMVMESKRSGVLDKMKEAEISQWNENRAEKRKTKKRFFSMFQKKNKEKDKRFTNLKDIINEEDNKSFSKYENLPSFQIRTRYEKEEKPKCLPVSPKKINLKIPLPHFLQQSNSTCEMQTRESSLPLIKKVAIPVNYHRNIIEKKKETNLDMSACFSYFKRQQSEITMGMNESQTKEISRKGRMMGTARRHIKGFNSFSVRQPREIVEEEQLHNCLTLLK